MNSSRNFCSQVNAVLRKNLIQQKRDTCPTVWFFLFPLSLLLVMSLVQIFFNDQINQGYSLPIPHPKEWPALLHIPVMPYRAVATISSPFVGLAPESCRSTGSCPVTLLLTGDNRYFGLSLAEKMFPDSINLNSSQVLRSLADMVLGSEIVTARTPHFSFLDHTFFSNIPLYSIQLDQCSRNSTFVTLNGVERELRCARGLCLWRNSSSEVNDELFKGYHQGNLEGKINEFVAAYDLSNSNKTNFNVTIWYNSTESSDSIARLIDLISNAYLQSLQGESTKLLFDFLKEMPDPNSNPPKREISSIMGILIFAWAVMQLCNVLVTSLVREKELKQRVMMKMHGLNHNIHWVTSYLYFLMLSMIYMLCLALFGSVVGIGFFALNDIRIQLLFYFIYINLQISLGFLMSHFISNVKVAAVLAFGFLYGSRLLAKSLFEFFVEHPAMPRIWTTVMELYPGFSLYRGLYEFAQYALIGSVMGTQGMKWEDLSDTENGMKNVLVIMLVEWLIILFVAYYIDQPVSPMIFSNPLSLPRNVVKKRILFLILNIFKNSSSKRQNSPTISSEMENHDVSEEREKVDKWLLERGSTYTIVCDNLKKVLPGKPKKMVVRGLSLAISKGECFGILGQSGAGKTSIINMMTGIAKPTSGKIFIEGLEIESDAKDIYNRMGYCPQKELLWGTLTGREHLLFYGRLRNLRASDLLVVVKNSLERVQLIYNGISDKVVDTYSRVQKRRLSIATSLLGDPQVVYMDEPTLGIDPISRTNLWNGALKHAKQDRTVILTTNSAEEAEFLCDRIGILVNGSFQYIGSPQELKAKYKETFIVSITASLHYGKEVEELVRQFSPSARKIFQISETQKFELPKKEVNMAAITQAMLSEKSKSAIHAWALTRPSLEDVLTKVDSNAEESDSGEERLVSAALSDPADPSGGDDIFSLTSISPRLRLIERSLQNLESRFTAMESWLAAQPGPSSRPFPPPNMLPQTRRGGDQSVFAGFSPSFVAPTPANPISVEEITTPIFSFLTSVENRLQTLESRLAVVGSWIADRPGSSSHGFAAVHPNIDGLELGDSDYLTCSSEDASVSDNFDYYTANEEEPIPTDSSELDYSEATATLGIHPLS